jgi:acyl-[acyl-carrier-protein]-phospholipid O-acyltransferase/long-chain-fatty-acid--[acyl-carrier-protein] ligase
MPATTSGPALRRAIQDLGTEAFAARKLKYPVLHRGFVRVARRRPWLTAMADSRTPPLSYFKAFIASIILGRKLRALLDNQPMVGILLPPTVGGALTNIALQIMGRIPINLNYTASPAVMASCAQKCHITQCVTARAFLERLPLQIPGQAIYLEDIMATVTGADRVAGLLLALLCPVRLLERLAGGPRKRSQDDLATVIFSSGSEGEPKGVMVTHYNMLMNIMGMEQVVPYAPGYIIMGFLPFFHSFGFAGTLWAPLTHGMCAVYHPNPLEARVIGQLIYKYKAKFLVATSTFLQNFIRRCSAEDLKSLTFVMVGAEKLPPRVRDAFLEKFGIEPLEGYGTTECSPGVSVNIPDYKDAVHHQKGNKRGTVGRPFPGISVRVVDPDTGQAIEDDRPGLLQVKGPNIMKGYLGMPDKTAAVIQDGWYSTGDIASIDEDGFITITDRLARFSKIAGEMISHTKVEETLHGFLGLREQSLAVTGVPDTTRGERLVVLHTLPDGQLEELLDRLEHSDLPNLWRPRTGAFYRIDQIPVLGTGKMDIKAVRALAAKLDLGE